jgi:NADP-dependent 3-hydroxy acid dehydrogenase YdfG
MNSNAVTTRTVVITGASAGLGAALAERYAEPGTTLGLLGRNSERLAATAAKCRAKGGSVVVGVLDVTDFAALSSWMRSFHERHPIDLLICNAGVFTGNGASGVSETPEEITWLLRTNLEGAALTVTAPGWASTHHRAWLWPLKPSR